MLYRIITCINLVVLNLSCFGQDRFGSLAPNAIRYEQARFSPVLNGAIVVQIDNETELIDYKGKVLIPKGKYDIHYNNLQRRFGYINRGFFEVSSKKLPNGGIINSNGILIYQPPYGSDFVLEDPYLDFDAPYCVVSQRDFDKSGRTISTTLVISYEGKVTRFGTNSVLGIGDHIITFSEPGTGLIGYADLLGKIIVKPQFIRASNFSEGRCAIAVKKFDNFLWGFIDNKGQFIISPRFKTSPSDFSNGLAAFTSIQSGDHGIGGFINNYGDTIIKIPEESEFYYDNQRRTAFFRQDYFLAHRDIVNRNGTIISDKQFLINFNFPDSAFISPFSGKYNFLVRCKSTTGVIFLDTLKTIPPVFEEITLFDDKRNVASAMFLVKAIDGGQLYRKGIINKEGIFIIYSDTRYP